LKPQVPGFFGGKLEHEIGGKAPCIALHRQIQRLGLDSIKSRQVGIKQNLAAAQHDDSQRDMFRRNHCSFALVAHIILHSL
jgi:hypothetical protein